MARKITTDAINAFMSGENFSRDNTVVCVDSESMLYLHGNLIAKRFKEDGKNVLMVSNAGWFSNTTKERLNGIPGVSVCQRKGVWYLNGVEWDGSWKVVCECVPAKDKSGKYSVPVSIGTLYRAKC